MKYLFNNLPMCMFYLCYKPDVPNHIHVFRTFLLRYGNGVTDLQVMEEIKKYVPPLQAWLQKHTQYTQSMMGGQR